MSKPIIHVPLDNDELLLLTESLEQIIFSAREYGDSRLDEMETLLQRLQEEYCELAKVTNSEN